MVAKRRFLDVHIVEGNTVYREVPFNVVVDWVQQGRLVEDDMLRWSGQAEWFRLGTTPAFSAYLPRADPFRAEDQAEALEPVEFDFAWKRRRDEEEDDVDMIPLIDVSLVLLIFFMMISTIAAASLFTNPAAANGEEGQRDFWVGIKANKDGDPREYFLGQADKTLFQTEDWNQFVAKLREELDNRKGVEVTLFADEKLKFETGDAPLLEELEKHGNKVVQKYFGVKDKRGGR